ncbi:MAG: hypothetical protein ACRC1K_20620 [Planctomycetia bacterium]
MQRVGPTNRRERFLWTEGSFVVGESPPSAAATVFLTNNRRIRQWRSPTDGKADAPRGEFADDREPPPN